MPGRGHTSATEPFAVRRQPDDVVPRGRILIESRPPPSREALLDAVRALVDKRRRAARPNDLDARDPAFICRVMPLLELLYDHYFSCETELECEIDARPMLAVANHNGMSGTPDMFCHMVAFWRRYGAERRAYGLMHDIPFTVPWAGPWLNACGAVAANPHNAARALRSGGQVLVFPGGDIDACKPYRERYTIQFAGRRGFVRTAIREQVDVLPIVSAGAHSSLWLWSDGRAIADALGLPTSRWRSNVFPIGFALPWGIIFGNPIPHLPPPVKIHTRVGRPIALDLPPEAADDREAVDAAYTKVVGVMQDMLDELRREGRHGLRAGLDAHQKLIVTGFGMGPRRRS
jgi:1-acyl-sn-glycerol-3-phosphate acyltransferase